MPRKVLIGLFLVLLSLITIRSALNPDRTQAAISACSVTVGPNFQNVGSSGTLSFGITNNDDSSNSIRWIKITAPSSNFVITNATGLYQSSFELNSSATEVTIKVTGLSPAEYGEYYLSITTGNNVMPAQSFTVQVSDTDAGDNPVSCSGDTTVSITSPGQEIINISNLLVSFTSTSAVIAWNTTASATSQVEYGTTNQYGSLKTDSSLVTTHAVSLTGLSSSTVYHFRVTSVNANNDTAQLTDNTFTTAATGTTTTSTVTVTTATTVSDTTLPGISVSTIFSEPYEATPVISGVATDNSGVSQVEYSIDGGKNWIPVDKLSEIGAKSASFEFTPVGLSDGNFKIRARATDSSGNKTVSKEYTLIIDRLPPLIGGALYSIGPQIIYPKGGVLVVPGGIDINTVFSSSGGVTRAEISTDSQTFSLASNSGSSLWSGKLNFDKVGEYKLDIKSEDGAGNVSERDIDRVLVLEPGSIVSDKDLSAVNKAKVSVFVRDVSLLTFSSWDADTWSQINPQEVGEDGKYHLVLPPGTYYVQVEADGFKTLKTNIFEVTQTTPIVATFKLSKGVTLNLGPLHIPLSIFGHTTVDIDLNLDAPQAKSELIGKDLPFFELFSDAGAVDSMLFRGKPTLISVTATWHPQASAQMKGLEEIDTNANVLVVTTQDSISKTRVYSKKGQYDLKFLADPDGALIGILGVGSLPAHYFVDRRGVVTEVLTGLITKEQILKNLSY